MNGQALEVAEPLRITTPAGFLMIGGRPFREEVQIHALGSFCEAVNHVNIEKYLDGLVNAEFSSRWNEEAIAAQVVAARTYALFQMQKARKNPLQYFDIDATVQDQVYDGSIREDFRSSRAVDRSKGWALFARNKNNGGKLELIKAFYHSTCGGRTELPENVWGNPYPGFAKSVRCEFCGNSPLYKWDAEYREGEVIRGFLQAAKADNRPVGWPQDAEAVIRRGKLIDIRVERRDPQGRVQAMATLWTYGNRAVVLPASGAKFRQWLGSARLRSATFDVRSRGVGIWSFEGRGYGHGVGLCQYGAKGMGERGYTMSAILKHYYPDAVLQKLW